LWGVISAILLSTVLQLSVSPGTISGIVLDVSGAPLAGAVIRAQAPGHPPSETISREDGTFTLAAAPDAPLELAVSAQGFADHVVRLGRDRSGPVRIRLSPRGLTETLTVSADPDLLRVTTPVSATTVDRESLASSASLVIDDQLRSIPGFSLFRRSSSRVANPTTQGVTLRGLAASGASRTAVFADGIPLNDPFGGWVYWDRVPVAAIDRIEVARGGSSDLHGSDALGGAIRISTTSDAALRLWLDGGSHATARLSGYAGRRLSAWTLSGAVETSTTDGFVIVAPESRGSIDVPAFSEYTSAFAGLSVPLTERPGLVIRGSYFTEDRGNGTPFQSNATIVRQLSGGASGAAWGGLWTARLSGASQDYDQTFSAVSADRTSERPTTVQHVDVGSGAAVAEWLRGAGRHGMLINVTFRQVDADLFEGQASGGPIALTPARQRTAAASVQGSFQVHDRVSVGTGLRSECWRSELRDDGGHRTLVTLLPRASLAWRVSDEVSLRTTVHRAYRSPTINELYRPFRVGNVLTRANDALDVEESLGVEGALFGRRGRTAARLTAFWTRLDQAIVNVTLESTPSLIVRQRQNVGRIRAAGVEVEVDARLTRVLSLTGSAAYIDSIFTAGAGLEGFVVPQVPDWQIAAGARGLWPRVSLSIDWRYVGRQFDDDRNQFRLDPSSMVNARGGWRVRPSLELFAAVENAFDQEQDVGRTPVRTVGLPRTARVGLRWSR
jgi:outer membrane receptor protein involved in Fe transport